MPAKRPYRVLIVDDNEPLRQLLRRAMVASNLLADTAVDGMDALVKLKHDTYDAVVTDLKMPRMHGYELVSRLLDEPDHPLIVAMTGVQEPRLIADLMARGVADVVLKPLDCDYLVAKIRALLGRQSAATDAGVPRSSRDLSSEIDAVSGTLETQLASITASFEKTIAELNRNRNRLENTYVSSVRMFTNLISRLGSSIESHSGRVERMATHIGERLGLKGQDMTDLQIAALLHEIGQFGMPDRIRNSPPWLLQGSDRECYQRYPATGAIILSEIPGMECVASLVEQHAENYDGTGFPFGKKGAEILLGARITRIADGFDTFIAYSDEQSTSIEEARSRLARLQGSVYDPDLFQPAMLYVAEFQAERESRQSTRVLVESLRPGMMLAESIYDTDGKLLVRQEAIVTESMRDRLANFIPGGEVLIRIPESPTDDNDTPVR